MPSSATAAIIAIGDEILSGRTKDKNIGYLAEKLTEMGVDLREARIVADDQDQIVEAVNTCRARYAYVFTSGGIGPTHDDITADAIARAFDVEIEHNDEAIRILTAHYEKAGIEFNEARKRMARIPVGAALIENSVSAAPGFRMENVYVMAGVPKIMHAMFEHIRHELVGGPRMLSRSLWLETVEGAIAGDLAEIQDRLEGVQIGSYPSFRTGKIAINIVLRGRDKETLEKARDSVIEMAERRDIAISENDLRPGGDDDDVEDTIYG